MEVLCPELHLLGSIDRVPMSIEIYFYPFSRLLRLAAPYKHFTDSLQP
jgi:hypothetical protein